MSNVTTLLNVTDLGAGAVYVEDEPAAARRGRPEVGAVLDAAEGLQAGVRQLQELRRRLLDCKPAGTEAGTQRGGLSRRGEAAGD